MSLNLCILASGSSGNSTYVASESTSVLIDAGLSGKETIRRLEQIGVDISTIQGICLSHEHRDHTNGLRVLQRRFGIPLYANAGTIQAVQRDPKQQDLEWNIFTTGSPFQIGNIRIDPFSVPHDAYEPVGFVVGANEVRAGIATDMGTPTTLIRERLRQCQAVIVESNHDESLLQDASRPWPLKQRIMGRQGHLSNRHAATMVAEIASPRLQQVFLAHLSEDCNRQDLALNTTRETLDASGHHHMRVSLTYPDRVSEIWRYE